jgi:hypothetical protein
MKFPIGNEPLTWAKQIIAELAFSYAICKIYLADKIGPLCHNTAKPRTYLILLSKMMASGQRLMQQKIRNLAFARLSDNCGPTWARTKDHLIMSQVL